MGSSKGRISPEDETAKRDAVKDHVQGMLRRLIDAKANGRALAEKALMKNAVERNGK